MKKIIILILIFLCIPLWSQDRDILDYMYISGTNSVPETELSENDAFRTSKEIILRYRKIIIKTAKNHYIEPELLAGVIFVETYGGGVSGWFELKNRLSVTKQLLFGNATIGITQVTPEDIKSLEKVINYNYDIIWQLNKGAQQLRSIRDILYPNTVTLTDERLVNILRYYNQGTKLKLCHYSKEDNPVAHYALAHYKRNLRIRKRHRTELLKPYYSNEIIQYNKKRKSTEIYVFGIHVADCYIGGNRGKANNYAWTAYSNRERIKNWLWSEKEDTDGEYKELHF